MKRRFLNGRLPRSFALLVTALISVGWTSCFRGYDLSKVKCAKKADCPNGYYCQLLPEQMHGLCVVGNGTDGGRPNESDGKANEDVLRANDGSRDTVVGGSGGGRFDAASGGAGGSGGYVVSGEPDAPAGGSGGLLVGGESSGGETTGGVTSTGETGGGTSTGETGGVVSTGGNAAGGSNSNPDAPVAPPDSGLLTGARCTGNGDCANSLCIDGFCCDKACSGCFACAKAMTGEADGTCAPVSVGIDPHTTCADETSATPPKPCGNDGNCDGKGACRKVGDGQKCGADSCNAEGTTFTPASKCDGKGTCVPGTPQVCAPYECAVTGCKKTCSTQDQCDTKTTYCDTVAGICVTKKPNGTAATKDHEYECSSGIIADGVCCDKQCTDVCTACTAALNGHEATTTGSCMAVTASKADPRGVCAAVSDPCGQDGTCNGSGACRYRAAVGDDCGTPSCNASTSMITKSTCSSSRTCVAGSAAACPGAMACSSTSACKAGSCVNENDCASGHFCASGVCTSKYDDGHSCSAGANVQCRNGNCVGTTCCSTPCGECRTCANSTGTCTANTAANGSTCSTGVCNNGTCNQCTAGLNCPAPAGEECWNHATDCSTGSSVCKKTTANNGIECGDGPSCSGATRSYGHWTCASGTCTKPTSYTTCPSTGCNTSTGLCNAACNSSTQIACGSTCCPKSTQYCNSSNVCANKLPAGDACPTGNECQSGTYCVSGTCCESQACGHDQTCSSGRCACTGLTFTCGGCGVWTFGTGSEGWLSDPPGKVTIGSSGGRLAVSVNVTGYDMVAFWVPICPSGSMFLYNYYLSADISASSSQPLPYSVINGATYAAGAASSTSPASMPLELGSTTAFRVQLTPDVAAQGIGFTLLISNAWSGTVYVDNVRVTAN